ncbi:MAG: hypothetical protein M4D80_14030 [Myxococcota bacterium]|nr:hypothetical protein [Deltaproteobacteria bacterium]MDQ3336282.1 hypothetical protein [Myxococcota bacterium]
MRTHLPVAISLLVACAGDGAEQPTSIAVSGSFAGNYNVPIATALDAAATFHVDEVDWTVVGSTVTLDYDLPVGLVGGDLDVTLTGEIDHATQTVALSGPAGTGTCTASASIISCREVFTNLGALPISIAVVEAYAAREYPGPVEDRVRVARMFASEPIGIVAFDLNAPVIDDDDD